MSVSFLYLQNSVDFVFNKWSFFTLQEYGWFYALQSMPYVLWNINSVLAVFVAKGIRFQYLPLVVISSNLYFAF